MTFIKNNSIYLAWVIALSGLILSVYLGEMLRFEPCRLCWYQRIFLFPLSFILGIAAYRQDRQIVVYALPLALMGALFALYHVLELYLPFLSTPALCGLEKDCTEKVFQFWGFVTLPLLSFGGFVLISLLLLVKRVSTK